MISPPWAAVVYLHEVPEHACLAIGMDKNAQHLHGVAVGGFWSLLSLSPESSRLASLQFDLSMHGVRETKVLTETVSLWMKRYDTIMSPREKNMHIVRTFVDYLRPESL